MEEVTTPAPTAAPSAPPAFTRLSARMDESAKKRKESRVRRRELCPHCDQYLGDKASKRHKKEQFYY